MNNVFLLNFLKVTLVSTVLALSVSGCVSTIDDDDDDLATNPGPEPLWKEEFRKLRNDQLQAKAVTALLEGNEGLASQYLEILLENDPNSYAGQLLEKQINLHPSKVLGERFVVYASKKGDSLMDIAQRFTGERLKFYAIARFNDITIPNRLPEGILVKVPNYSNSYKPSSNVDIVEDTVKTSDSKPISKPEEPEVVPVDVATTVVDTNSELSLDDQVNELFTERRYAEIITLRESDTSKFDSNAQLKEKAASSYLVLAQQAFAEQKLTEASSLLSQSKTLDSNGALSEKTSKLQNQLQISNLIAKAKQQESDGLLEEAIGTYEVLLTLDEGNRTATKETKKLVKALSDKYFKSSLVAREAADYKTELKWLNKVLDVNPNYEKAIQRKLIVDLLVKQVN